MSFSTACDARTYPPVPSAVSFSAACLSLALGLKLRRLLSTPVPMSLRVESCGIPYLAKNERDMGPPHVYWQGQIPSGPDSMVAGVWRLHWHTTTLGNG